MKVLFVNFVGLYENIIIEKTASFNTDNKKAVLKEAVDFRSRRFAFRGRLGEPPRRFTPAGSPLTRASRRSLRAWNEGQQSL
jgi:hypothetical protein